MKINDSIKNLIEKNFKKNLDYFIKKNKIEIQIEADNKLDISEYIIEFKSKNGKLIEKIESLSEDKKNQVSNLSEKDDDKKKKFIKKKKFYKKKFYKKKIK